MHIATILAAGISHICSYTDRWHSLFTHLISSRYIINNYPVYIAAETLDQYNRISVIN